MTKEEFINGLSEALAHTAARDVIIRNIEFYRSYIDGEIAKGRSEREVMDELGDPRLIANSIKEAEGLEEDKSSYIDNNEAEREFKEESRFDGNIRINRFEISKKAYIMIAVIIAAIVVLIIAVLTLSARIAIMLMPLWLPVVLIIIVYNVVRRFLK